MAAAVTLAMLPLAARVAAQQQNTLLITPASLTLSVQKGHDAPTQTFTVIASQSNVSYTATAPAGQAWYFVVQPQTGTPSSFQLRLATSGLAAGDYSGQVTIASQGVSNPAVNIPITLHVTAGAALSVTPNPVNLTAAQAGTAVQQTLTLASNGDAVSFASPGSSSRARASRLRVWQAPHVVRTTSRRASP